MKRSTLLRLGAIVLMVAGAERAWARRGGPPSGYTGSVASSGNDCADCHSNSDGGLGSVQIIGAPIVYEFNTPYDLTIRIEDPARIGAGFQISAEDPEGNPMGNWLITDSINTQLNINDPSYANHTGDGVDNSVTNWVSLGNAAEYQVRWVSPAAWSGPVKFWAAGNAINNNFSFSGDHVYTTSVGSDPVPAASEWAMLILGLSILTAATLIGGRRRVRLV